MGFRIEGADFADMLVILDKSNPQMEDNEITSTTVKMAKGQMKFSELQWREDSAIYDSHYNMADDVLIAGKGEGNLVEMQFNLSANGIYYKDKKQTEQCSAAHSANITFLAAEENQAQILFKKDEAYNTFDIHLSLDVLNQYYGESKIMDQFLTDANNNRSTKLWEENLKISPAIFSIIQNIRGCTFNGLSKKMYVESKSLELIATLMNGTDTHKQNVLNKKDTERIMWAANLLRENLHKPTTIVDLAREVGINQTKLKEGFKVIFGSTIFSYQQTIRMDLARKYLLDSSYSIQEIGLMLGYQNTSNFSTAFRKIHGYSPQKLRGNKP